jgi:hypothetical protein
MNPSSHRSRVLTRKISGDGGGELWQGLPRILRRALSHGPRDANLHGTFHVGRLDAGNLSPRA